MLSKILGIGAVIVLTAALLGGGAYLLLRDSDNGGHFGQGAQIRAARSEQVGKHGCRTMQELEIGTGNGHSQREPLDLSSLQGGRAYRRGNPDAGKFRATDLSSTAP